MISAVELLRLAAEVQEAQHEMVLAERATLPGRKVSGRVEENLEAAERAWENGLRAYVRQEARGAVLELVEATAPLMGAMGTALLAALQNGQPRNEPPGGAL